MTTVTLTMPRLGETMEEGTVADWLVAEGDAFERGAPLIEFETDKTAVEYPALGPGRLVKVLVGKGDLVKLGQPLAEIALEGAEDWVTVAGDDPAEEAPQESAPVKTAEQEPAPAAPEEPGIVRATPLARRAARQAGISLAQVRGTGRRGRIELADVQRAATGGAQLAESAWGPAAGQPILMVHGFAGDRITFEQLGMALGRAGFSARAVDLPGHGETGTEVGTFDDLVAALAAQLDPANPVHAIGHSLGAAALVAAAARTGGAASLTLIAPAGLGLAIDGEFVAGMAEASSPGAVGHLLRRLSDRAATFSDDAIARIHAALAAGRLKALAADICRGGHQSINIRSDLAELAERLPVRLILGLEDRIIDWRDALDVSPAIALHVCPRAGHMPHWDDPAAVAALIGKDLRHG